MTNTRAKAAANTEAAIAVVADLIKTAERIFVLAGAGLSTESGIADFRGPNGMWTKNPGAAKMFDAQAYASDPALRRSAWQMRRESPIRTADPNQGHQALFDWERSGRYVTIATQNIDGLQQRTGSGSVLELHGTFREVRCLSCGARSPSEPVLQRVDAGDPDPACPLCDGVLRTNTVAFGESLDPMTLYAAQEAATGADVAFAIGSSLVVEPAAGLIGYAAGHCPVVIINADPTPYDALALARISGQIGPVLSKITRMAGLSAT